MIPLDRHDLALLHVISNDKLLLHAIKVTKKGTDLFPLKIRPHLSIIWKSVVKAVVQSKKDGRFLELNKEDIVASCLEIVSKYDMLDENKARLKTICEKYLDKNEYDLSKGVEYLKSEIDDAIQRDLSKAIYSSSSFEAIKKIVTTGDEIKQDISDDENKTLFVNPLLNVKAYLKKEPKTPMGVTYFDKVTCGGMSGGEICLVAGLTGGGKSAQAIQFVGSQLILENCVAWFTYEQPFDQDLMQRMVSFITGYSLDFIRGSEFDSLPEDVQNKWNNVSSRVAEKMIATDFSNNKMLDKDDPEDDFSVYSIRKRLEIWKNKEGRVPTYVIVDWLGSAVKAIAAKRGVDVGQVTNFIAIANDYMTDLVQVAKEFKTRIIIFHQLDPIIKKSPPSRKPTSVELQFIKSASNWVDYAIVIGKRDENQRCWYICDKNRKAYPVECVVELEGEFAKFKLLEGFAPGRNGQFINISELQDEMDDCQEYQGII